VFDGTEVHEASAALAAITRAGAEVKCYAPDRPQRHVVDHAKGEPIAGEERNVMAEAARIARGAISPLKDLKPSSASALIIPGGFGAAKNLSDFAVAGGAMEVAGDVERVMREFHAAKKPIGMCCIAPVLAAKVFGGEGGVTLTLGCADDGKGSWPYAGSMDAARALGATVVERGVGEVAVDEANRIVTTPAYMYEGKFHEIHDGVAKMVDAVLKMTE